MSQKLYPHCGCPAERIVQRVDYSAGPGGCNADGEIVWEDSELVNVVCRNPECLDYGTHRIGYPDDRCQWCSTPYTLLREDPFRGAR